jgi:KDO2-lipid IV(A) lauroyltransferase
MAAAAVAARGVPIEAIVKRQSNPLVDARLEEARRNLGIGTVEMGQAPRRIPRVLQAGEAVGIVADQDARRSGIWVPFFGVPASTHRGPALFALRFGAPLFAAVARRLPDGRYRLSGSRIDTHRTEDFEADIERVTAALALHLENEIRKDPTQYFWFHQRWKTARSEELPSPTPGTKDHDGAGEIFL